MNQRMEQCITYAQKLVGADVYYRESWECYYFSLQGKCFGLLTDERLTLKNLPAINEQLREVYTDVSPGYYMNKQHWNTIAMDTQQFNQEELLILIEQSYTLVYDKLSKKEKAAVHELTNKESSDHYDESN